MPKPLQPSTYTLRTLIDGGFLYVDKTRYLYQLVRPFVGIYFLARPRRFGKSLTISTLAEIFLGNKELFRDQWIYQSDYDWQPYPVLRFDFSRNTVQSAAKLEEVIDLYIGRLAQDYGIRADGIDFQSRLVDLVEQLGKKNRVVILVDEYDKPILDNIGNLSEAQRIRDTLKAFYTVLKSLDQYLRFVLITGISKFSRVGIFSGMNNLIDLTMSSDYATLMGITEEELHTYFTEHIAALAAQEQSSEADLLAKIRQRYDGFCFVERCPNVYNPYSTLQLFFHRRFSNYWFETGTPTFLIKLLKQQRYDLEQLDDLRLREISFSTYEIESLLIVPLLFQTGYLTIKAYEPTRQIYTLSYPNQEVADAFTTYLLASFSERERALNDEYLWRLVDALEGHDLPQFFTVLAVFFANVPYDLQLKDEKYYQTIFYLIFKLLGLRIDAEVRTNQGRIDTVIELADHIFLFEFKLDGSAAEALQQIKTHAYAQKYRLKQKPLTLVGVNFDSTQRQVRDWQAEEE